MGRDYECKLYVPYYDEQISEEYMLYSVSMENSKCSYWNIRHTKNEKEMELGELQTYFNEHHYKEVPVQDIIIKTFITEQTDPIYMRVLNKDTTSVFLGIYLAAWEQIKERKFRNNWKIICVTGDIKYNGLNKPFGLKSIDKPAEKYAGDFKTMADKKDGNYLFLYISDNDKLKDEYNEGNEKEGITIDNITIKRFSPDDKIEDIIDYIFKPFNYQNYFDHLIDSKQIDLCKKMESQNPYKVGYIQGDNFKKIEKETFNDTAWRGYFIPGRGGSGKSALAMEIARFLVCQKKIYAPIWIRVTGNEIQNKTEKPNIESEISSTEEQIRSGIDSMEEELKSKEKYLIIIDNIELPPNGVQHVLDTIIEIFPQRNTRPYIIITSRNKGSKADYLYDLQLTEQPLENMKYRQIKELINAITKESKNIKDKIEEAKSNGKLDELIKVILDYISSNPRIIITAILLLKEHIEIDGSDGLIQLIEKGHERHSDKIRAVEINIYQQIFSFLSLLEKQVLYLFLEKGSDISISIDRLKMRVKETEWGNNIKIKKLEDVLHTLDDYYLIESTMDDNKPAYYIESIPFRVFLFENEFSYFSSDEGEFFRDKQIGLDLQLAKALRYDQDEEIVRCLLERMKEKNINFNVLFIGFPPISWDILPCKNFALLVSRHSSSPEIIFPLLEKFGFDICVIDPLYGTIGHEALHYGNIPALNWIRKYHFELLATDLPWARYNIFHLAVEFCNTDILNWLKNNIPQHTKEVMIEETGLQGGTIFHTASKKGDVAILGWLLENMPEKLLCRPNRFGSTVFHEASENDNTDVLNLLYSKAPQLLPLTNEFGDSVFHQAAYFGNTTTLQWFYEQKSIRDLLYKPNNDTQTVFHYAIANDDAYLVLDWLYKNTPEPKSDFLRLRDNNNDMFFHCSILEHIIENPNYNTVGKACDWIINNIPEEWLKCEKNHNGNTFYDILERRKDKKIDIS